MHASTGSSSDPTSRTVASVNRRPTCRPMPANANLPPQRRHLEPARQRQADAAGDQHRPEQRTGGQPRVPGDDDAGGREGGPEEPALQLAEHADALVEAARVVARERERHEHRRRDHDDEDAGTA